MQGERAWLERAERLEEVEDDDNEGNEMEKSVELSEALSTERILL